MTSQKQLEANQQNAQQSTGPKTDEGKAIAKLNSVKHGILAREVVIQGEQITEDPKAFQAVLERFWEDLAPMGAVEDMLVERIAICYWRLRRVLIAEHGAILQGVDVGSWNYLMSGCDRVLDLKRFKVLHGERDYCKSTLGIAQLVEVLEEVKQWAAEEGTLTEGIRQRVVETFGTDEDGFALALFVLWKGIEEKHKDLPPEERRGQVKTFIVRVIEDKPSALRGIQDGLQSKEDAEYAGLIRTRHVPDKLTADHLLRYETALERQLYRALNELERRQRHRRGEAVPPPVSVEVSTT